MPTVTPDNPYDRAFAAFTSFRQVAEDHIREHYSETDTRVKFVDRILVDVLGWDEFTQIRREERHADCNDKRCVDYTLSLNAPVLVVEAKKVLRDFEIPDSRNVVLYSLDGIVKTWRNAWDAIVQCREYCDGVGARYGLVSNGRQFLAFRAISDSKPWNKTKFLAFRDLQNVEENFTTFFDCLSSQRIAADHLTRIALGTPDFRHRSRARQTLPQYAGGYRNELAPDIDQYFRPLLLDAPTTNPALIETWYALSDDDKQYSARLKSLLIDPLPDFSSPVHAVRPGKKNDPFKKEIMRKITTRQPVSLMVVMGGTGAGKTTFLRWFLQTQLEDPHRSRVITAWCDFRELECEPEAVHDRTITEVLAQVLRAGSELLESFPQLKEVFRADIESAKRGVLQPYLQSPDLDRKVSDLIQTIQSDHLAFLERCTRYLQSRDRAPLIVLDNMDQKSDKLQTRLYHTAHEVANRTNAATIVVLRESTFRRHMRTRQFDAFAHVDFHVRAHPIAGILKRRLDYLEDEFGDTEVQIRGNENIAYAVRLAPFLDTLRRSFCDENYPDCVETLQSVGNSDIRRQLRIVYRFLTSGQTKLADYVGAHVMSGVRPIPFHEFLHSILLGDRRVFEEGADDQFMNLFERAPSSCDSYFTSLRILAWLVDGLRQTGELKSDDFVTLRTISKEFTCCGLSEDDIRFHLQRMIRFGLLVAESQEPEADVCAERIALTKCGLYYLQTLCYQFAYVSPMSLDTTIDDAATVERLAGCVKNHLSSAKIPLHARAMAARVFVDYLMRSEDQEMLAPALRDHPIFAQRAFTQRMHAVLSEIESKLEATAVAPAGIGRTLSSGLLPPLERRV
jgi:Cdc6-like AAA superfamily ATPase